MANICTFTIRILGTEENCEAFNDSPFTGLFEWTETRRQETEDGVLVQIDGECRGSIESKHGQSQGQFPGEEVRTVRS